MFTTVLLNRSFKLELSFPNAVRLQPNLFWKFYILNDNSIRILYIYGAKCSKPFGYKNAFPNVVETTFRLLASPVLKKRVVLHL